MKNIRNSLILVLTFLMLFAVGCSKSTEQVASSSNDSKDNYKKLTGKFISQGVFLTKYTKGYCPRYSMERNITLNIYAKGKSIEFLNDKDIIISNQKLKYEWTDSERISITNPSNNATTVYKFSYNNGVFRFYDSEEVYVDYIKEGTAYTPEKPCIEDLKHPAIDATKTFLDGVSRITGSEKQDGFTLNVDISYISPKLKDKLIGEVADKTLEKSKIREALKPLASSIREFNIKDFALDSEYAIKEKSDNKAVIEVYVNNNLFKTFDLELIDSKWKIAAIN